MSTHPNYIVLETDGIDSQRGEFEIVHRERSYRDVVVAKRVIRKDIADLFSAAPDLLAACKALIRPMLLTWPGGPPITHPAYQAFAAAEAAIAKAEKVL